MLTYVGFVSTELTVGGGGGSPTWKQALMLLLMCALEDSILE